MELHAEKISDSIRKINTETTGFALEQFQAGRSIGKLKPFTASFSKFISVFFRSENRFTFRNRLISAYLASFSTLVKYLKLLKLNNRF